MRATIRRETRHSPTIQERKIASSAHRPGPRNADNSDDPTCSDFPSSSAQNGKRGFTGQEMMDGCFINYNARIYNPTLGRFTAADPVTQDPYNLQDLNRYAYVTNNPLTLDDPTGLVHNGGGFFKTPLAHELEGIAIAFVLDAILLPELEVGTTLLAADGLSKIGTGFLALNAGIAGGASGAVSTGTLKGALMGGLEAEAFFGVGQVLGAPSPNFFSAHTAEVFIAHGAVGGLFSIGSKGGFGSGFLAAGIGSLADAPALDTGPIGNVVTHAVAGGIGSMLGGGKFANGAATGAFGYLFNNANHIAEDVRTRIAQISESLVGSDRWDDDVAKDNFGVGTNKCNKFVYDVLTVAGASPGTPNGLFGTYIPTAGQWADPNYSIPHWRVLGPDETPEHGDVVAQQIGYSDASGHTMIVGWHGNFVGTGPYNGQIEEIAPRSNLGREGIDHGPLVFRRWNGN